MKENSFFHPPLFDEILKKKKTPTLVARQCSVVLNKRAGVGENACFWENFKSY